MQPCLAKDSESSWLAYVNQQFCRLLVDGWASLNAHQWQLLTCICRG